MSDWTPFRPTPAELERVQADVAAIPDLQQRLLANSPGLHRPDRVAHQYQIAGGRVVLTIAGTLPDAIAGIGLFQPGVEHRGIGRLSTGLGCPHAESDPDFLGLMAAFLTAGGDRADFIAINDPAAPTDNHPQFMALLAAAARAAGLRPPLAGPAAASASVAAGLVARLGPLTGLRLGTHILHQTLTTARSKTAFQGYWTGVVEVREQPCKFVFVPAGATEDAPRPAAVPVPPATDKALRLSAEWQARQSAGPVGFDLLWLPFRDERTTPLDRLTKGWRTTAHRVGSLVFPRSDAGSREDRLWAALAAEMGANPGNWPHGGSGASSPAPLTAFALARQFAYRSSQAGRDALADDLVAEALLTGRIGEALAAELDERRTAKRASGHVDDALVRLSEPGAPG